LRVRGRQRRPPGGWVISTSRVICVSASRITGRKGSIWRPIVAMASSGGVAGQVRSLVRQDGIDLLGIQRI